MVLKAARKEPVDAGEVFSPEEDPLLNQWQGSPQSAPPRSIGSKATISIERERDPH